MAVSKFSGDPCKIRHIFNVSWVLCPTREYSTYEFYILKDQFWEVVCLKGKKKSLPPKSSTSHNGTKPQISIPTEVLCRRWTWTLRLSIYFGKSRSPSRQSNAPPRANQNALLQLDNNLYLITRCCYSWSTSHESWHVLVQKTCTDKQDIYLSHRDTIW